MVEQSSIPDPVGEMCDRFTEYLDARTDVHRIGAARGQIGETVAAVEQVIAAEERRFEAVHQDCRTSLTEEEHPMPDTESNEH